MGLSRPLPAAGRAGLRLLFFALVLAPLLAIRPAAAQGDGPPPAASDYFAEVWARADRPVSEGLVNRTWMWGPLLLGGRVDQEQYLESPGGQRAVMYFDKSRMEITDPGGDPESDWFVTNGLLVVEMISGRMQVGDNTFVEREPARVNVAGDGGVPDALTYALVAQLVGYPAYADGAVITNRVSAFNTADPEQASISVSEDPTLAAHNVTAAYYVPETGRRVASVFWEFMSATGTVYLDGEYLEQPLFPNPFYATGLPITEAYWTTVQVGGTPKNVLLQCFERRCLTYTPDNPEGWQVEAGNVGQHYHEWRHEQEQPLGNLADQLGAATSDEARYETMLEILGLLNVPVYAAEDGSTVVPGSEATFLYDDEVWEMAVLVGSGDLLTADDLALILAETGLELSGQELLDALGRAAGDAYYTPGEPISKVPLLLRALGFHKPVPYDLGSVLILEDVRFDVFQAWLIVSDFSHWSLVMYI